MDTEAGITIQSMLKAHTGVTQCASPRYMQLSRDGWCVTMSETGVSCVGGTLMLFIYSAQPWLFHI